MPLTRRIREAYIPAQRPEAGQEPRVPQAHVDPRGPCSAAQPSLEGPGQAVSLIESVHDRRTFAALRAEGVRVRRGPLGIVHLRESGAGPRTRVAFAITKRVGGAVQRNRLRRRLRAVIADLAGEPSSSVPSGVLLVSAGPEVLNLGFDELRNDVKSLLIALETRRST